jgi:hypothetical protein
VTAADIEKGLLKMRAENIGEGEDDKCKPAQRAILSNYAAEPATDRNGTETSLKKARCSIGIKARLENSGVNRRGFDFASLMAC